MEIAEWDGDCYFHHSCHPGSLHDDRVGADILHLGPLSRLGAHDGHRSGSSPWPVIYFRTPLIYFYICIKMLFQMREFPNCKLCVKGVSRLWRTTFQHWWCNWLNQNLGKIDTRMKDFDLSGLLWSGFLNNLRSALAGFWSIATFFIEWHYNFVFWCKPGPFMSLHCSKEIFSIQ